MTSWLTSLCIRESAKSLCLRGPSLHGVRISRLRRKCPNPSRRRSLALAYKDLLLKVLPDTLAVRVQPRQPTQLHSILSTLRWCVGPLASRARAPWRAALLLRTDLELKLPLPLPSPHAPGCEIIVPFAVLPAHGAKGAGVADALHFVPACRMHHLMRAVAFQVGEISRAMSATRRPGKALPDWLPNDATAGRSEYKARYQVQE